MTRKFTESELVIATHNPGKVREIAALLAPYDVGRFYSAGELGLPEPVEDGETFAANAVIKAKAAALASGKVALADDSGLAVHALGGAPGIYSARWAGPDKDFGKAMLRVHHAIEDAHEPDAVETDRSAYFVCALALAWPDGHVEVFEGRVDGQITWPPRGDKGFGYDPIFVPDGSHMTYAEIEPVLKHQSSHRARAFALLTESCFEAPEDAKRTAP